MKRRFYRRRAAPANGETSEPKPRRNYRHRARRPAPAAEATEAAAPTEASTAAPAAAPSEAPATEAAPAAAPAEGAAAAPSEAPARPRRNGGKRLYRYNRRNNRAPAKELEDPSAQPAENAQPAEAGKEPAQGEQQPFKPKKRAVRGGSPRARGEACGEACGEARGDGERAREGGCRGDGCCAIKGRKEGDVHEVFVEQTRQGREST